MYVLATIEEKSSEEPHITSLLTCTDVVPDRKLWRIWHKMRKICHFQLIQKKKNAKSTDKLYDSEGGDDTFKDF